MIEKQVKFSLTDLATVRVRCLNAACGVITEVPITELARVFQSGECPACRFNLKIGGTRNVIVDLANAVNAFKAGNQQAEVQFVLQDKN